MGSPAVAPEPLVEPAGGRPGPLRHRTSRRRRLADRTARAVVSLGGLGIIVGILGILFFIVHEIWPLFEGAKVRPRAPFAASGPSPEGLIADEHRAHVATVGADGVLRVFPAAGGREEIERPAVPGLAFVRGAAARGGTALAAASGDGKIVVVPVSWKVRFDDGARVVTPALGEGAVLALDPAGAGPALPFACTADADGRGVAAAGQLLDGRLVLATRSVVENEMTGESRAEDVRFAAEVPERLSVLAVDAERRNVFGGTPAGRLYWWRTEGGALKTVSVASAGPSGITSVALLIGDRSLVVGQADGSLSVWFPVRPQVGTEGLARVRDFPRLDGAVTALSPSLRDKGFLAATDRGAAGLYYSTSERTLWTGRLEAPVSAMFFAPKADGAFASGGVRIFPLDVHDPHPEVSFKALFGKVWYEGYGGPAWVWQSSSGTDDFEPKLSLTPLLVGTLKGTVYSLLLAIPLAILSAIFASQFLDPALRRYVKPAVEIMASLPSVVLGFLAGLWLAPRVEKVMPGLILMGVVLPAAVLGAGWAWKRIPRRLTGRLHTGAEVFFYAAVLVAGASACLALAPGFERAAFSGSFSQWLLGASGMKYDQRNAVVVGLAMGFAVIPIIFAIADDALSNVPRTLSSGSLALGATRWQTVWRVVLPAASPGIFAAVMVGFGRAVGETMIVLMATGNTPIMDWSPFNGFRTLSANIAVEVPEAPFGGTLYRTLFLAALLLFALTFVVNTAAEVVRHRLRRRYARF